MRKAFKSLFIRTFLFCTFTTMAYADFGSKPRVEINLENCPSEEYYLDLLYSKPEISSISSNLKNGAMYDEYMLQILRNNEKDGLVTAMVSGTPAPVFGSITGNNGEHIFSYVGVPDTFKIIIVEQDGSVKISETIKRKTMEMVIDVDYSDMSITIKSPLVMYPIQFGTSLLATFLIEFFVFMLFRYRIKNNIKVFLIANFLTQLGFSFLFSSAFLFGGTFGSMLAFIPLEIAVTAVEVFIYKRKLIGKTQKANIAYALCANLASALLTYFNFELIFEFMTNLIR